MHVHRHIVLFMSLLLAQAQHAQFMQEDLLGSSGIHPRICISRTPDGGEIIGRTDPLGTMIMRIAPSGQVAWAKRYPQVDNVIDIGTYPEGDHYALALKHPPNVITPHDLVIMQLDTNGEVNWSRIIASSLTTGFSNSELTSNITHDGNGDLILTPATINDVFILRLSRSGSLKWSVRYNSTAQYDGGSISAMHRSGTSGLAGTTYTVGNAGDGSGFWLLASDTMGQCLWEKSYDLPLLLLAVPLDLLVTADKRLVITGRLPEEMGPLYTFILLADSMGDMIGPLQKIQPLGKGTLRQVFELADGSLAFTGIMASGPDPYGLVARYTSAGVFLSAKFSDACRNQVFDIGSDGSLSAVSIPFGPVELEYSDRVRLIRGDLYDQVGCEELPVVLTSSPVLTEQRSGYTRVTGFIPDPFVVTAVPVSITQQPYCGTTGIVAEPAVNGLSIHPVPASDRITLRGWAGDHGPVECDLVDLSGQVVLHVSMEGPDPTIDVGSLPQGSYLLILSGEQHRSVARTVIVR